MAVNDQPPDDLREQLKELKARYARLEADAKRPASTDGFTDQYRDLFEKSADAILIIDGETFVDCNQATVDMLRYANREQLLATHPSQLSPPVQPDGRQSFEKANEMILIAFRRGSHRFEWDHRRADGEVFPVEVLLTAVPREGRPQLHVVWRDITERKKLEAQLVQAQKMEAIGQLAGGIAHDFNNLLFAINGNAEMLLEELSVDQAEALGLVREIHGAGERAADLTRQLLAFSRKQVLRPRVLDLNDVLDKVHDILSRLIGAGIQIVIEHSPRPAMLKADSSQIEQILINLATNARDAMPGGGELTLAVTTRCFEPSEERFGIGEFIELSVTDTGSGMDPETQRQAFEPFFTTKGVGRGTGLGLATVYGIVRQSGGDIAIRSSKGEGTTFTLWLPVSDERPALEPVVEVLESDKSGTETVLVVEDEAAVSSFVGRLLRKHGYTVLVSRDGVEALDVFEQRSSEIDLVISDVVMPRMGGPEFVATLSSRGYQPRVIFVSGYADSALESTGELAQLGDFLRKPVRPDELLRSIRARLDRH